MMIKLDFSNPIMVSTGDQKDKLKIIFEFPSLFRSASDGRVLEDNFTISTDVPLQMQSEAEYIVIKKMTDRTKSILDYSIILPLILQAIFAMVMHLVWGIISNLQLITNINAFEKLKTPP